MRKLGFPEQTASAVRALDEHWNGAGSPSGLAGEEIPHLARIVSLAQTVEVFASERGWREALEMARSRSGRWFDPELVRVVCTFREDRWWEGLAVGDPLEGLPGRDAPGRPPSRIASGSGGDLRGGNRSKGSARLPGGDVPRHRAGRHRVGGGQVELARSGAPGKVAVL